MRTLLAFVLAGAVLGGSASASMGVDGQRARDLLSGIFQDVGQIVDSLAGGPNDPKSPVSNAQTLRDDTAHLNAATDKATQLAGELQKIEGQTSKSGH